MRETEAPRLVNGAMTEKRGTSEGRIEGLRGTVYGVKGLYKIRA